jgi:hypothetical protein
MTVPTRLEIKLFRAKITFINFFGKYFHVVFTGDTRKTHEIKKMDNILGGSSKTKETNTFSQFTASIG